MRMNESDLTEAVKLNELGQRHHYIRDALLLCSVLLIFASCSPRPVTIDTPEGFEPSARNPAEILEKMTHRAEEPMLGLRGRARAQLSSPGNSERSSIQFASDRKRTLITFRNNLGIEGGRLLVEPDSVTLYNRVDQFVRKVSVKDRETLLDHGFYAVNILSVLEPDFSALTPRRVHESATAWQITFSDNTRMVFDKETRNLIQIEYYETNPAAFSSYLFSGHTRVSGKSVPSNIQILSRDRKSSIFLSIQSVEVNPSGLRLDLEIPPNIPIRR